jgi:hypothetical protein
MEKVMYFVKVIGNGLHISKYGYAMGLMSID